VTDANGEFIFKGHTVRRVVVDPTPEMRELDRRLQAYLRLGYRAGERIGGSSGRAIGFVMTTYRKLASSSVAAIDRALRRRLDRLQTGSVTHEAVRLGDMEIGDSVDDIADRELGGPAGEFFDTEAERIQGVLDCCSAAAMADTKIEAFRQVYDEIVVRGGCKMLVFSEYRATQDRLVEEVHRLSGRMPVQIHGGQKLSDKITAMEAFDSDADVLISTEAGGEGLNLHRNCHVVVNFDLPWNPARIAQRIGRIYRYGQTEHVVVLNFHSKDTIDTEILSSAMSRVEALASEMATVSGEYNERYATEILGELLDQLDLSSILSDAMAGTVSRTEERIKEAVQRAQWARTLQEEILSASSGFDPTAFTRLGRFKTAHVMCFVQRIAPFLQIEVAMRDAAAERFQLRLSEEMRGRYPEFAGRLVIDATTSRTTAARVKATTLIDFGGAFLRDLVTVSSAPEFGGGYASLRLPSHLGEVAAFLTRWQSEQGEFLSEELHMIRRAADGSAAVDDRLVDRLLEEVVATTSAVPSNDIDARRTAITTMTGIVEKVAAPGISRLRTLNDIVLLAVADARS
jgi:hypothetical protein